MQRGFQTLVSLIRVRSMAKELRNNFNISVFRGIEQRCPSFAIQAVNLIASGNGRSHVRDAMLQDCQMHRVQIVALHSGSSNR